jgi:CheY-like chemotaxis protein
MTKKSGTILIVDDDADIREVLKIALEGSGYRVSLAANGSEALAELQSGPRPALILLDMMMPQMDGEEFLKHICRTPFAKIPVLILSGNRGNPEKAKELGAADWLVKPVDFDDFLKVIRRFAPADLRCDAA